MEKAVSTWMQGVDAGCSAATKAVIQLQNVTRSSNTKKQRHSEIFPEHLRVEWKAAMGLRDCTQRIKAKKAVAHKFRQVLSDIRKARDIERLAEGRAITQIVALKPIGEVKKPSVPGNPDAPGFLRAEAETWKTAAEFLPPVCSHFENKWGCQDQDKLARIDSFCNRHGCLQGMWEKTRQR